MSPLLTRPQLRCGFCSFSLPHSFLSFALNVSPSPPLSVVSPQHRQPREGFSWAGREELLGVPPQFCSVCSSPPEEKLFLRLLPCGETLLSLPLPLPLALLGCASICLPEGEEEDSGRFLSLCSAPGCPRWHRVALGAGWTGNVLLGVAVVALGCSCLLRQPENQGSCKIGNGNVGDINSIRENVLQELREALCLSQPPAAQGCRICPQGWTLQKTKCYWVSTGQNPWNKSLEQCRDHGATLLLPWDQDALEFLNDTLQKSKRSFWIGLWMPEAGKGWVWVNGSSLDRNRFQLEERPGECGTVMGDKISSDICTTTLQSICQKEATKL